MSIWTRKDEKTRVYRLPVVWDQKNEFLSLIGPTVRDFLQFATQKDEKTEPEIPIDVQEGSG